MEDYSCSQLSTNLRKRRAVSNASYTLCCTRSSAQSSYPLKLCQSNHPTKLSGAEKLTALVPQMFNLIGRTRSSFVAYRLRILYCHCSGAGSVPGQGNSKSSRGHSQKNPKQKSIIYVGPANSIHLECHNCFFFF